MLNDGEKGVIVQRDKVTYAITPRIPCGIVSPEILRKYADIAEKYKPAALKLTGEAKIMIIGLKEEDIESVWSDLGVTSGSASGPCIKNVKACPGATFCKKGIQDSLSMGMKIESLYYGMEIPGKFKIGVSGCPHQCAESFIKDIGLIGVKDGWKIVVGGNGGVKPRFALELKNRVPDDEALSVIERIISFYKESGKKKQRLGAFIEEIGFEEFRTRIG